MAAEERLSSPADAANLRTGTSSWPIYAALAIVVAIAISILGVDLVVDHRTAEETQALVGDSLRSVALADDLRYQAYRLSRPNLTDDEVASIAQQIDLDARAYDQLTPTGAESTAWSKLESLLAHLRHEQPLPAGGAKSPLIVDIESTIRSLVDINERDAARAADEIASAHHGGLVIDTILGSVTLALAALVALALRRTLGRQRDLLTAYLNAVSERQRDLAAFASRVSHDLKAPLSPIRGYADLLTMHTSPDVSQTAQRISRGVQRMTTMIDELLSFSMKGTAQGGSTPIAPIAYQVLEDLHGELADAEVKLELGGFIANCSPTVLTQTLSNVLSNAAKFRSTERKLTIRIEARGIDGRIAIVVQDNGVGMDSETSTRAFESAFRGRTAVPGHGLGLSIVKRLVTAANGDVRLESQLGVGTTVTVTLPGTARGPAN